MKPSFNCETCNGKGLIETYSYYSARTCNEALVIEKCDECNIFSDDVSAAKFALDNYGILSYKNEQGVNIKINFSKN